MIRLRGTTKYIVERTQMDYLNEIKRCTVTKDIPELYIGGERFGPYQKKFQVDLPMWAIETLRKHDYVELLQEEDTLSLVKLQKILRTEENSSKLQTFDPLLYSAIKRRIFNLQSDKSLLDPRLYDEIEKIERVTPMLLQLRLTKIVQVARSGAFDFQKNMTFEEKWLCQELVDLFSEWENSLFK